MTVVVDAMTEKHNVQLELITTVSNLDWRVTKNFPKEVTFTEEGMNPSCLGRKSILVRGNSACKGSKAGGDWHLNGLKRTFVWLEYSQQGKEPCKMTLQREIRQDGVRL